MPPSSFLCFYLYIHPTVCKLFYAIQNYRIQFSNRIFSTSYISSVFRKTGNMHFCFTSKEILSLDDHTLCCLEGGTSKLFPFILGSPTSDRTKSTSDVYHKAHLSGVTLFPLREPSDIFLPLPSSSTLGHNSQPEGQSVFYFNGL